VDFFASQDLARRKTKWLVFYFLLAVVGMVVGIYAVGVVAINVNAATSDKPDVPMQIVNLPLFFIVSMLVMLIVGGGSIFKILELRGGGSLVAAQLGGRRLQPNSSDPAERRILNVVEEMALAAGTPVPPVYILDNEPGINAFAAGYTVDDAVIGVNRGTIEQLNRDELQGVVAHEFSHILNGDMRMSIRMIGVLHGIQLMALIGYFVLRGSAFRSSGEGGKGVAVIFVVAFALIAFGSMGLFFARLIKASVSRQREYLADASAVQFTRNPDGISGALKMIGASAMGSQVQAPRAELASHLFFANMFKARMSGMLATHPPLEKRICELDPQFNGSFQQYMQTRPTASILAERAKRAERTKRAKRAKRKTDEPVIMAEAAGGFGGKFIPGDAANRFPLDPILVIASVGLPTEEDVEYSQALVEQIPEIIAGAARDPYSARCLVFATLINPANNDVSAKQLSAVEQHEGEATLEETKKLLPQVAGLAPSFRLPVFEIVQGTLVGLSGNQYESFRITVEQLIMADGEVSLFEFFLQHHLLIHLDRHFGLKHVRPPKYKSIYALQEEISQILGILVRSGHDSQSEAEGAFAKAMEVLKQSWGSPSQLERLDLSNESLAKALDRLAETTPQIKKQILLAAATAVTYDGKVTVEEAELFRAISESLDCPVPPVVAGQIQAMKE